MKRQWLGVYVASNEDANKLFDILHKLKETNEIPTLDWDTETNDCEDDDN